MRHQKRINHLGRKSAHRKAMLSNMAISLILHKRISTTLAKAKALRVYIEPLITTCKEDTTHARRHVFSHLQSKEAVSELFREISQKVSERPGGYTRILKLGPRLGDNAEMAMIELVDFNELMLNQGEEQKGKTTRRRRGTKKKETETEKETETVKPSVHLEDEPKVEIVSESMEETQPEPTDKKED